MVAYILVVTWEPLLVITGKPMWVVVMPLYCNVMYGALISPVNQLNLALWMHITVLSVSVSSGTLL
uniref:Uncharacterized protein n=1 Tax=Anguilla anguilla TaxID=7936 RepID=A0A0E9WWM3_ANGAN